MITRELLEKLKTCPETVLVTGKPHEIWECSITNFCGGQEQQTSDWRTPRMTGLRETLFFGLNDGERRIEPLTLTVGDIRQKCNGRVAPTALVEAGGFGYPVWDEEENKQVEEYSRFMLVEVKVSLTPQIVTLRFDKENISITN